MPTTTYTSWTIVDLSNGRNLGVHSGATHDAALDTMARHHGHDDFESMCAAEGKTVEAARANMQITKGLLTLMMS